MQKLIEGGYGMVPKSVMLFRGLSIGSKALYSMLLTYADSKKQCFPQAQTMMDNLQISRKSVFAYLKELEDLKLLERSKKYPGSLNSSNKYHLYYPDPENDPEFFEYTKSDESIPTTTPGVTVGARPEYPQGHTNNTINKNTIPAEQELASLARHPPASPRSSRTSKHSELKFNSILTSREALDSYVVSKYDQYIQHSKPEIRESILKGFKWLLKHPKEKKDEYLFMDHWLLNAIERSEITMYAGNSPVGKLNDHRIFINQVWLFFSPEDDGLNNVKA